MNDVNAMVERRTDSQLPASAWRIGSEALVYAARQGEGSVAHDNVMGTLAACCHFLRGAEGKQATAEFLRGLADDIEGAE